AIGGGTTAAINFHGGAGSVALGQIGSPNIFGMSFGATEAGDAGVVLQSLAAASAGVGQGLFGGFVQASSVSQSQPPGSGGLTTAMMFAASGEAAEVGGLAAHASTLMAQAAVNGAYAGSVTQASAYGFAFGVTLFTSGVALTAAGGLFVAGLTGAWMPAPAY
ncbi:MAG TPA: hypothetical protein VMW17_06015, partial [Candidatus Binatia bacterium]|nr:hypothetical protein [Candidatus Binatia bacterium]